MFKLINQEDSKVFSSSMFIKNADFFKDEVAFFDAFSKLCEKSISELPNYCVFQNGKLCLEGVCLFFKTYASEFSFKTIELSIDYLKTLYYAIAALSKDGKIVEKDMVLNEYLIYKEANHKQFESLKSKLTTTEKTHNENKLKFDHQNSKYAKYFVTARVLSIIATIAIILSFAAAMIPAVLYYVERITLKRMLIIGGGILLIGLVVKLELNMVSKYLTELAMDVAYSLQILKKNKNDTFNILNDIKEKNSKILSEYYEYLKGLDYQILKSNLEFDAVLKMAVKNDIMSFNIRADVLKIEKDQQKEIFEILDRLANVSADDVGRLENIYGEIVNKDHLKFNNLVRYSFLNRFIENAKESKHWRLDLAGIQTNPFDIDAKALAESKIAYLPTENNVMIETRLNTFYETKYAKKRKYLQLKNIKNDLTFYLAKAEFIDHFYDYETLSKLEENYFDNIETSKAQLSEQVKEEYRQIPSLIDLKLGLIKNRIICNTLGEQDFFNIQRILFNYETARTDYFEKIKSKEFINDNTIENINFIYSLFECKTEELGNGEVLCIFEDQKIKGYKLSNV